MKKQFWIYLTVTYVSIFHCDFRVILFIGISIYDTTSDGLAVLLSKSAQDESTIQFYLGLGNSFGMFFFSFSNRRKYFSSCSFWSCSREIWMAHRILYFSIYFSTAINSIFPIKECRRSLKWKYVQGILNIIYLLAKCKSFKVFAVRPVICMIIYSILFGITLYGFGGTIFPRIVQKFKTDVYKIGFMSTTLGIGMGMLSLFFRTYPKLLE